MKIEITKHAYDRFVSDRFCSNKLKNKKQITRMIQKDIEHSILLKLYKDNKELRGHNGKVYVCERKEGMIRIITILKGNNYVK